MIEAYLAGIFGILGVLVGALIQYWCAKRSTEEARFLELKSEAYADFVNAVATAGFSSDSDFAATREKLAAAKTRICIFGDKEVIDAVVRLEKTSLELWNVDAKDAFLALIQVVRAHSIASGRVGIQDLEIVLFGNGVSVKEHSKPKLARDAG